MEKQIGQMGFADALTEHLGGGRTQRFLDQMQTAVAWDQLEALVAPVFADADQEASSGGAPHWPVGLLVRCLLLQKWYDLSDPQLEEQLHDRLSFRRFVGLSLSDAVPDETTFCVFRRRLRERDLDEQLFASCVAHLQDQGLLLQEGTLVDATIIEAPRPRRRADGSSRGGDAEGSYLKKRGQIHYGYRAHIATDGQGLIRQVIVDTAKVSELTHFETLTSEEAYLVLADSGLMDRTRERRLTQRGVQAAVMRHRVRGQKQLTLEQRFWNRCIAPLRALVELPFAGLKRMGLRRTRYRGRRRNWLDVRLTALAWNFQRSLSVKPSSVWG